MYETIYQQCDLIVDETLPPISNIANILAILYHELENINWAGIYYCDDIKQQCILGPFQGKIACTKIPYNKGVVGTAAQTRKTIVVDNVHEFPGHIACDCSSNSEIVIPLIVDNTLYALLDIDSIKFNNFDKKKSETLQQIAHILSLLVSKESAYTHLP